jgi:RNA-directed DNA polymerase
MYEWKDIPWRTLERNTFKLQKRIFQATKHGDVRGVRKLQRLLITSKAAAFLAVRRVAQDNPGKNTAGVDGETALTSGERRALAEQLMHGPFSVAARPVRRVWIPKPGVAERRPLGIPTIGDRARQALMKLALEPEWEAKFETDSFGFRPGRSAHDAIQIIHQSIANLPRYVLDADIAKCFDRIDHHALLRKLDTFPALRRVIKHWLKAGVMDGEKLFPTQEGTPQGGILSPLLANIALHGLQTAIEKAFPAHPRLHPRTGERSKGRFVWYPKIIRYADDFVILHQDREALEKAREITISWLKEIGLELKPEKTRITHTLNEEYGKPGFDFLGFHIRQYRTGKNTARKLRGKLYPFRTFTEPSKDAIRTQVTNLRATMRSMRTSSQEELIAALNPKITGWANYFATSRAGALNKIDHVLFQQLKRWSRRRHPMLPWKWVARKYWRLETGRWTFGTPDGAHILARHSRRVMRPQPVRGASSIFDGDWAYWAYRLGRHPAITPLRARLLKRQRGMCDRCGLYFTSADEVAETSRTDPNLPRDRKHMYNFRLLHARCNKNAGFSPAGGINDNDRISGELDERKLSRPVLKTSALGD